jgi:hypothetical protein
MLMGNSTKRVVLGMLLLPFALGLGTMEVLGKEMPMISIPTDDGSTNVQIFIENAILEGNQLAVDQPQVVKFSLRFLDAATGAPIEHVNYNFVIMDAKGNIVHKIHEAHAHDGMSTYSLLFSDTGSFTITIDVEGAGAPPYDTRYSGSASSTIAVTPEFPLSVMAIMAAVVGIGVVATRLKYRLTINN